MTKILLSALCRVQGIVFVLLIATLWSSCDVKPENPYDPDSPPALKAKGSISGTVILSDSADRSGVQVRLLESGRQMITGPSGSYMLAGLDAGTYTVQFSKPGYATETRFANLAVGRNLVLDTVKLKDLTPPDPPRINESGGRMDVPTDCDMDPSKDGCFADVRLTVSGGPYTYAAECDPKRLETTYTTDGKDSFAFEVMGGVDYPDWARVCYDNGLKFRIPENAESRLRVRKVDPEGNHSADDFIVITEDSKAPDPPVFESIVEGRNSVRLAWNHSQDSDVLGYRLYYGASKESLHGTFASQGSSPLDLGYVDEFTLSGLNTGSRVFLALSSIDSTGHEGAMTPVETALPNIVTPEISSYSGAPARESGPAMDQVLLYDGNLVVARGAAGLDVWDVSIPSRLKVLASGVGPKPAVSVAALYNRVVVGSGPNGVCVQVQTDLETMGEQGFDCLGRDELGVGDVSVRAVAASWSYSIAINDAQAGTAGLLVLDSMAVPGPSLESVIDLDYPPEMVAVSGELAVVGYRSAGTAADVFDLSDPSSPRLAASLSVSELGFRPNRFKFEGDRLYVLGAGRGAAVLDVDREALLDPAVGCITPGACLDVVGVFDTSGSVMDADEQGGMLVLADKTEGLVVVDTSDPADPGLLGTISLEGETRLVTLNGAYAFVSSSPPGLYAVELGSPTAPRPAGSVMVDGTANDVAVAGRCALVPTDTGKLYSVDLANPTNPRVVFDYQVQPDGKSLERITMQGTCALVSGPVAGLYLVDAADPCKPVLLGAYRPDQVMSGMYPMPGVTLLVALEDTNVSGTEEKGGMVLLDLTDIGAPKVIASATGADLGLPQEQTLQLGSMVVTGGTLWIVERRAGEGDEEYGLYKGNVESTMSCLDEPGKCIPNRLEKVDLQGVSYPSAVFELGPGHIGVLDMGGPNSSRQTLHVLSSLNGEEVAEIGFDGQVEDIGVSGEYAYAAAGNSGIEVMDLSELLQGDCNNHGCGLEVTAALPLEDESVGLEVYGTWLVAAQSKAGLVVLDLE